MTTPLPYPKNAGFTFLEIMIGMVILGLIGTGAVASYVRVSNKNQMVNAGNEMLTLVRDVQKRAQSGEKPDGACEADQGQTEREMIGWYLRRVEGKEMEPSREPNNIRYEYGVVCQPEREDLTIEDLTIEDSRILPSGVEFSDDEGMGVVTNDEMGELLWFEALSGKVVNPEDIKLVSSNNDYSATISINSGGAVELSNQ